MGGGERMVEGETVSQTQEDERVLGRRSRPSDATPKTNRMSIRKCHWNEQLGDPRSPDSSQVVVVTSQNVGSRRPGCQVELAAHRLPFQDTSTMQSGWKALAFSFRCLYFTDDSQLALTSLYFKTL